MLDGVDVYVVHVGSEVSVLTDKVFPITPLPDSTLSSPFPRRGSPFRIWERPGKARLDQPPTRRKIGITSRKFEQAVKVIRQDDESVNAEGMARPNLAKCVSKGINVLYEQLAPATLQQIHRKEPRASGMPGATVVGHWPSIAAE